MTVGFFVSNLILMRQPKFRHSGDKLAYAIFTVCYSQGFRLYATGALAFADDALATASHKGLNIDVGWNEFEDKYAFAFFNVKLEPQDKVLLKCYLQNNKKHILIKAAASADSSRIVFLTLNVGDFIEQDYDPKTMFYQNQFKNLDYLITLINDNILIKLLLNWSPQPTSNFTKHLTHYIPQTPTIHISTTTDTMKVEPPQNHYEKCYQTLVSKFAEMDKEEEEEKKKKKKVIAASFSLPYKRSLVSKFAEMDLADTNKEEEKKKKKKVNSASFSLPYKRRSVKNNKKNNCLCGGSKKENGGGVTLFDLPYDMYKYMKEAAGLIEHLKTFKDDKKAMEKLESLEVYFATASYYHKGDLPTDWTYNRETCREDVSKCYWEIDSFLNS